MKVIMKILVGLAITSSAFAEGGRGKLFFMDGYRADDAKVRSTHSIQSIERRGSTLKVTLVGGKLIDIPLINEDEAKRAESYARVSGSVWCFDSENKGTCEYVAIDRFFFRVDLAKVFPEVAQAVSEAEKICNSKGVSEKSDWGLVGPIGVNTTVQVYEKESRKNRLVYSIRGHEVTFLNNTDPTLLDVKMFQWKWNDRNQVTLVDPRTCQAIGLVPSHQGRLILFP